MKRTSVIKNTIYNLHLNGWKVKELSYRFGISEVEIREILKNLKNNKNIQN